MYVDGNPISLFDPEGLTGNSSQRRKDKRERDRNQPPGPVSSGELPSNRPAYEDGVELFSPYQKWPLFPDLPDLPVRCTQWNCPNRPNQCSPLDMRSPNDFMPTASNAKTPPRGCRCESWVTENFNQGYNRPDASWDDVLDGVNRMIRNRQNRR
jgi:hypothetical protein